MLGTMQKKDSFLCGTTPGTLQALKQVLDGIERKYTSWVLHLYNTSTSHVLSQFIVCVLISSPFGQNDQGSLLPRMKGFI
jgi:hypothetical protein